MINGTSQVCFKLNHYYSVGNSDVDPLYYKLKLQLYLYCSYTHFTCISEVHLSVGISLPLILF